MVSPAEAALTAAWMVAQFGSACVQAPALFGLTCQVVAALAPGGSITSARESAEAKRSESAGSLRPWPSGAVRLLSVRGILILLVIWLSGAARRFFARATSTEDRKSVV